MPSLTDHKSSQITKLLLLGDSKTGKTSSLASLVKAGYKLRILDYDNLLESLKLGLERIGALDKTSAVDYISLRDKLKATDRGHVPDGTPKAFVNGMKALDAWPGLEGKPGEWGADTVVVIDSLTRMSEAAYAFAQSMNPGAKEPRTWYYDAQKHVRGMLAGLTSAHFATNVIVIAHVGLQTRPDGTTKGFPIAVGAALGPDIPTYFSSIALCESSGTGSNVKRTIRTTSTSYIDLANPAGFKMEQQLPIDTGLATFFTTMKG